MTPHEFTQKALARIASALSSDGDDPSLETDLRALAKSVSDTSQDDNTIAVLKADDEKQIVWGWALVSVEKGQPVTDLQGDVVDTDDLQHAVHTSYMEDRIGKAMHSGGPVGEVVDSIVFTKDLQKALGIDLGREGWFVGMKIHKSAVWELVKSGKLSAFSIGGEGERHPIEKYWSDAESHLAQHLRKSEGNPNRDPSTGQYVGGASASKPMIPQSTVRPAGSPGQRSQRTVLATHNTQYGTLRLVHASEGLEAAGAGIRPTKEKWGAITQRFDGTNTGQWFKTEAEARTLFERHKIAKSDDPTGKQDLHAARYVQGLLDQLKQRTAQTTTSIQGAQLDAGTHQDLVGPVHDHIKDAHQHLRAGNNDKAQAAITAGHQALDSADQELEYTHGVSGDDNTMKKNWSPQAREAAAEARHRAAEASNNATKVGTPEAHRNAAQRIRESQALHADNPKEMRAHEKAARYHEKEATERQAASDYKTYGPKAAGPEHKLTPAAHAIHQHLVSQPDGHSASSSYMHLDGHSQADLKHGVAQLKAKGLAHGGSYSAHGESHGYLNAAANVPVRKAAMFKDVMQKAAKL